MIPKAIKFFKLVILVAVAAATYQLFLSLLQAAHITQIRYYPDSIVYGVLFALMAIGVSHMVLKELEFKNKHRRYWFGFFLSFAVTILLLSLFQWVFYGISRGQWVIDFRMFKELMMIINFQALIALFYIGHETSIRSAEEKSKELIKENDSLGTALRKYRSKLNTTTNSKTLILDLGEVQYFQIEEGVVFAVLQGNKSYPLNHSSLTQLEEELNPYLFFRLNRSQIVNLEFIEGFEPYFKDRLAIKLKGLTEYLYTSNSKSTGFRKWIDFRLLN